MPFIFGSSERFWTGEEKKGGKESEVDASSDRRREKRRPEVRS
jgi:hypothetical protein